MRRGLNLTPEQALIVAAAIAALVAVLVVGLLLEALLGRGIAWLLRRLGIGPPPKSPARIAIDELEAQVRRNGR